MAKKSSGDMGKTMRAPTTAALKKHPSTADASKKTAKRQETSLPANMKTTTGKKQHTPLTTSTTGDNKNGATKRKMSSEVQRDKMSTQHYTFVIFTTVHPPSILPTFNMFNGGFPAFILISITSSWWWQKL